MRRCVRKPVERQQCHLPRNASRVSRVDRVGSTPRLRGRTRRDGDGQRTIRPVDEVTVQIALPAWCAGGSGGDHGGARYTAADVGPDLDTGWHVRRAGRFPMPRRIRVRRRSERQLRSRHWWRGLLRNLPASRFQPLRGDSLPRGHDLLPTVRGHLHSQRLSMLRRPMCARAVQSSGVWTRRVLLQ